MTEMNTTWQQIHRTDNVQEHFWLGEFIQSDKWVESSSPESYPNVYPYLKDGFEYRAHSYTYDNEIHVTEMTHATSFECMRSIINEGGFRSKEKDYPGIGAMSLVWFGLKIEEKEIDYLKENSKRRVQALMQEKPHLKADNVISQIACTPAFQPVSFYGHFKFTLRIKEVLEAYASQFCCGCPPEMKKLGTFAYKQETMHVILICTPNTPGTDNCPPLSDDHVMKPDAKFEMWTWKPHSTGNEYISFGEYGQPWPRFRRWEHVVFAFYVPKDCCLHIDDLERRVSLCLERSRMHGISGVNEDVIRMIKLIESVDVTMKKSLADTLISMIAGYLTEERLYEKTMLGHSYEQYRRFQLELVSQRLREILPPWEFQQLNWSPLTLWMNSLTRHSNVLHFIQNASTML